MTYVKPTSDIFIKYLFGKEEHKSLLIDFINAVQLQMNFPLIEKVELKNPFNIKHLVFDKESILDIKAVSETKEIYNIEVQTSGDKIFKNRSLYYWSKLYSSQLEEGDLYKRLYPVICINILDFSLFKETGRYHLCFMLREQNTPNLYLTDHLVLHFLELPELDTYNKTKQLEKWLYYLKNEGKTEGDEAMKILLKENPHISQAHEKYEAFTRDEELVEAYEAHMKWKRDYYSGVESAREEGLEKGREEGREEGLEKGREEGELIGKIQLFHEILGESVPSKDELSEKSIEKLRVMLADVEKRWMQVKS